MASQAQRDANKRMKMQDEMPDLFELDLDETVPYEQTDHYRLTNLRKSPLHLLMMIHHPDFALHPDCTIWVSSGRNGEPRAATLRGDAKIIMDDVRYDSLSAAAREAKKKSWNTKGTPDGWESVKLRDSVRADKMMSLNIVFMNGYKWGENPPSIDIMENPELLYQELCKMGLKREADLYHNVPEKKAKPESTKTSS